MRLCPPVAPLLSVTLCLATAACSKSAPPAPPPASEPAPAPVVEPAAPATPTAAAEPPGPGAARLLPRDAFNRLAAEAALPLFWTDDTNQDGTLQPAELAVLTRLGEATPTTWLDGDGLSPAFHRAHSHLADLHASGWPTAGLEPAEARRRAAVLAELRQGRPTLLRSDLRDLPAEDKALVRHIVKASERIEHLHALQNGVVELAAQVTADDAPSRALLHRNQGPWCVAPATEKDPDCNALASRPPQRSGLYPADLQADPKFCEALAARPDAKELMAPFMVVRKGPDGKLIAVPYRQAWGQEMDAVAAELEAAAGVITRQEEAALKAYLLAAAKAFRTGDWNPADEAWAAMNAVNSKWYLRIAPDETYFEPCARKAGFQVSFARIDQASLQWQKKLDPLKNDMEQALGKLAGPPYVARKVDFHLPDFIAIVLNAGDSRSPLGATIGQSLPNWGPVAAEGRGRTVAMANVGTDPDSRRVLEGQAASLFCAATMARFTSDPAPLQMSTVLHEAAHNLGPAHEYKVGGKTDEEIFGGPLAATLEELKAQSAALWLTDWLAERKVIDDKLRDQAHLADVAWAFGQVSSGMVDARGKPKPYPQLAAIQLGVFLQAGALQWHAQQKAANGSDVGCYEVPPGKLTPVIAQMMARVAGIKARGDKADAEALRQQHVEAAGPWQQQREVITQRWRRAPRASYVYAIVLD